MTRCPNCGSAIRIGAKFCTSCGFRLTVDEPAAASSAPPTRSPFSTTSTPAWSAAPVEAAVPTEATIVSGDDVEIEPAWAEAPDEGVAETAAGGNVGGDAATDEVFASEDQLVDSRNEPTGDEEQDQPTWFTPPAQDTSGPVSDDMVASLGVDHADRLTTDDASQTDDSVPTSAGAGTTPEALRTTYTWNPDDQQITAVRDIPTVESTEAKRTDSDTAAGDGDPLTEARALVVRLGDVLAAVRGGSGAVGSAAKAPTSVADEADVEALRSIVKAAQERPRDVDVMLDLVLRAETIAAVLTDRDLLLAALRGDEAAVEETWAPEEDESSTYPAWRALP